MSYRPGARSAPRSQPGPVARARLPGAAILSREDFGVKLQIDAGLCQGHGRCYDLAPSLFGDDEEGYGKVLGDGVVPPEKQDHARRAELNCPEHAIALIEGTGLGC
jgi:ferredoxin